MLRTAMIRPAARASIAVGWPRSSIALEEALTLGRLPEGVIAVELGPDPAAEALRLQHLAMARIVKAHPGERLGEPPLQLRLEIRPGREHAVIIRRRGPNLGQRPFRHEALLAHCLPEGAADRPGIGTAVENRAHDLDLASAGIAMLADIAVEAQGPVVLPLDQAFVLQEVNRQDRRMAAIAAAERERALLDITQPTDRAARRRHDLGHPAEIGIAHGDRPAGAPAPRLGLQKREIRVPADVDAGHGRAGRRQEGLDLRLIALEQDDLDRKIALLVKVAPHAFPDGDHLGVIGNGPHPDRPAHDHPPGQKSGMPRIALPMNSRRTSPVGAITAPAWASRNSRSMAVCLEKAAPPQTRIAVEVTAIAVSPAAALHSSALSSVVSRGRSRWST